MVRYDVGSRVRLIREWVGAQTLVLSLPWSGAGQKMEYPKLRWDAPEVGR